MSTTPVTVLAGFLGAGKTTLLNHVLQAKHGQRIGVLINDFGEINIDARLVAGIEGDSISLTNGCVCCSMRGDLVTSVGRLLRRSSLDHILLEASGVSDPLAIASTFRLPALQQRAHLGGVVTVVDAERARDPRLDQQLIADQIRAADLVLLNKVDLAGPERVHEATTWIREIVPHARIVQTIQADVPLPILLGINTSLQRPEPSGEHPHYATWTYRSPRPLAYRKVRDALQNLPPGVLRAKGILWLADAPALRFVSHLVGTRTTLEVSGTWQETPGTELVFIGEQDALTVPDLVARFDACATDAVPLLSRDGVQRLRVLKGRTAQSLP